MNNSIKKGIVVIISIICLLIGFALGFLCNGSFINTNVKNEIVSETTVSMTLNTELMETETSEVEKELTAEEIYNNFSNTLSGIKVGDSLYFGTYEQDNDANNGKESIEWVVLYKSKKNSMLVTSKEILDCMPYSYNDEKVTWAESDIRKFLNNEFYNSAFDDFSKHYIMENKMSNNKNANYKTDAGEDSIDKVFLLSESQANRYFKKSDKDMHNKSRACKPTEYAKQKGIYMTGDSNEWYGENSSYWLRTPGVDNTRAIVVEDNGSLFIYGENVTSVEVGVRPCIWIKY